MKKEIHSLGKSPENLLVQKAQPLMSMINSDMTLGALQILDVYLARINSRNPEKRIVMISRKELAAAFGKSTIRIEDLRRRLDMLFTPVELTLDEKHKVYDKVTLFEQATVYKDNRGRCMVQLSASAPAMKYFFNIENKGYIQYQLRCISKFTKRSSYAIFLVLIKNKFRKTFTIDTAELRKMCGCENGYYDNYAEFDRERLKIAQKEIKEYTGLEYTYKPKKEGRKYTGVTFTIVSEEKWYEQEEILIEAQRDESASYLAKEYPIAEIYPVTTALLDDMFDEKQINGLILAALTNLEPGRVNSKAKDLWLNDYIASYRRKLVTTKETTRTSEYNRLRDMLQKDYDKISEECTRAWEDDLQETE